MLHSPWRSQSHPEVPPEAAEISGSSSGYHTCSWIRTTVDSFFLYYFLKSITKVTLQQFSPSAQDCTKRNTSFKSSCNYGLLLYPAENYFIGSALNRSVCWPSSVRWSRTNAGGSTRKGKKCAGTDVRDACGSTSTCSSASRMELPWKHSPRREASCQSASEEPHVMAPYLSEALTYVSLQTAFAFTAMLSCFSSCLISSMHWEMYFAWGKQKSAAHLKGTFPSVGFQQSVGRKQRRFARTKPLSHTQSLGKDLIPKEAFINKKRCYLLWSKVHWGVSSVRFPPAPSPP